MKNTATLVAIVLIVVLTVLLLGSVGMMGFGMMGPGMMGYGGYGMMGGWGYNPFGWVLALVFWALVIAGIVLLVVWLARSVSRTPSDAALEILKARYARGEISKEQFEEMKKVLEAK